MDPPRALGYKGIYHGTSKAAVGLVLVCKAQGVTALLLRNLGLFHRLDREPLGRVLSPLVKRPLR